jgi:hypothetical protein
MTLHRQAERAVCMLGLPCLEARAINARGGRPSLHSIGAEPHMRSCSSITPGSAAAGRTAEAGAHDRPAAGPPCLLPGTVTTSQEGTHAPRARAQLLPILNLYKARNKGDAIDYAQREATCLGELIAAALALLERTGGPDAFINIKYMVPTYESALR